MSSTTEVTVGEKQGQKLGLLPLAGLVIGSMIGGGAFNLMRNMAEAAPLNGVIIAWIITGIGVGALVLSFQNLNLKRRDLDAGVYSYAKEGFGNLLGFSSAWGYWISAWIGNVSYAALLFAALGYFFSFFDDGLNLASTIGASVLLWAVAYMIIRGVKSSSIVNAVVTAAKLIPIAIFIVAIIAAFNFDMFTADAWGTAMQNGSLNWGEVLNQVKGTMTVTLWVFIGIEGAVVYSARARNRKDVGKATIIGFLTVLAIYILISVLSFGIMTQPELAALKEPSMAYVLESIVGPWGAALINIGVVVSLAGAWLAWTMFAAELPYQAAKDRMFPKVFARENSKTAPVTSIVVTCALIQLFIITFPFFGDSAYTYMFSLATTLILMPYLFSALFQVKNSVLETKGSKGRAWNTTVGVVASVYAAWLIYAAEPKYLLVTVVLYTPGIFVFWWVRAKEQGIDKPFKTWELVVAAILCVLFIVALVLLLTGTIAIV